MSRDDDNRGFMRQFAEFAERRYAVHARQAYVEDHRVEFLILRQIKRRFRRRGHADPVAGPLERLAERPSDGFLVIDDQHRFYGHKGPRQLTLVTATNRLAFAPSGVS